MHYESLIHRFIESAQLQPASATDHHAGLGGLVTHTLEVVQAAMASRRAYQLPINAPVEKIARDEMSWTYGVFIAAILHDAGKLLTLTKLITGAESYRIEWASGEMVTGVNTLYELQTRISVSMLTMLPPEGLAVLGNNTSILKEVTAYLSDMPYEWGTIGKLCRDADMNSVSADLQPGVSRDQVTNAPSISLAKRMMQALRAEIKRLSVPINKDGAMAWVTDDEVWMVWKSGIDLVRSNMRDNGSTDLPNDDLRMVSVLLDHGYIIPTSEGDAIWNVHIKSDRYSHALTVIKFLRASVIHPTRTIKSFDGDVIPISSDELKDLRDNASRRQNEKNEGGDSDTVHEDTRTVNDVVPAIDHVSHSQPAIADQPPPSPPDEATGEDKLPAEPSVVSKKKKKSRLVKPLSVDELKPPTVHATETLNEAVIKRRSDLQKEPVELSHEHIGRYFLTWVREAVDSGHFNIKSSRPPIHIISDKEKESDEPQTLALLAWPAVGHEFMKISGLERSEDKDQKKAASNKIRNSLLKEGLIIARPKKYSIWQALFPTRAGMTTSVMFCLVTPAWTLFDEDELPEFNEDITLRHGDYDPNHRPIKPRQKR